MQLYETLDIKEADKGQVWTCSPIPKQQVCHLLDTEVHISKSQSQMKQIADPGSKF